MYLINLRDKFLYIFCGVIMPLPLFFDIGSKKVILSHFVIDAYKSASTGAVPFGYFLLALTAVSIFFHVYKSSIINKSNMYELFFYMTWFIFLLFNVSVARAISISSIFFIILFFKIGYEAGMQFKKIAQGYFLSILTIMLIKLYDTNFCGFLFCNAEYSRSFLGYEIYQYYVSYAAVMALICCVSLITLNFSRLQIIPMMVLICLLSYGEVALTYRKAPIIELIFTLIIILLTIKPLVFVSNFKSNIIKIFPLILGIFLVAGLSMNTMSKRDLLGSKAISDRTATYSIAAKVIAQEDKRELSNVEIHGEVISNATNENTSIVLDPLYQERTKLERFLFGYQPGWGGYGNSFIEFFIRMGALGLLFFMVSLALLFKNTINLFGLEIGSLLKRENTQSKSLAMVFIFSMLLGNFVNLNIQLPYYYGNWAILLITSAAYFGVPMKSKVDDNNRACIN